MHNFGTCPACEKDIPPDRQFDGMYICSCGWTNSWKSGFKEESDNRKVCVGIVGVALLITGIFIGASELDTYSYEMTGLKLKQYSGSISLDEAKRMGKICQLREDSECSESAYTVIASLDPQNITHLLKLGEAQVQNNNFQSAVRTFKGYFSKGGKDAVAASQFASALENTGLVDDASKYYSYALNKKAKGQAKVARSYVTMLVRAKKYKKAKNVIHRFRLRNKNAGFFMKKELAKINRGIASR